MLPRSRELIGREPNQDLRLEISAEFLPQSAAITETLSGARWLTSADVTHEIIGGGGGNRSAAARGLPLQGDYDGLRAELD